MKVTWHLFPVNGRRPRTAIIRQEGMRRRVWAWGARDMTPGEAAIALGNGLLVWSKCGRE